MEKSYRKKYIYVVYLQLHFELANFGLPLKLQSYSFDKGKKLYCLIPQLLIMHHTCTGTQIELVLNSDYFKLE